MTPGRPFLLWAAAALAALAVPVALLGANVRIAFSSLPVYAYAIDAFDAPAKTGVSREELVEAMRGLIRYFGSSEDLITTTVVTNEGVEEPLFSPREAVHFRDVKDLLRRVYLAQAVAAAALIAVSVSAAVAALRGRNVAALQLIRGVRWGAYGTIAGVIVLGVLAALGAFNSLFIVFHLLSFDNDLWRGAASDRMVQLFPQTFFLRATLAIGLAAILEASLIAGAATVAAEMVRRRSARSASAGLRPASSRGG